jgi:uncharacterized protein (TIGR01777 family)
VRAERWDARSAEGWGALADGADAIVNLADEEIIEGAAAGQDFRGRTAIEWEGATAAVEALGVRRAIIRSGPVLSADGGVLPLLLLPFRFFVGRPLGSGRQWLPWIHIADEARAIRFLIENEAASGAFNLAAPNPLTNAEFSRLLGRVIRRPAFALRLALGDMSIVALEGQRTIPRRLLDSGFSFRFPEAEPALRGLLEK